MILRTAEEVLAFRAEVREQLEACVRASFPRSHARPQFRFADIEALAHWLEVFERLPWTDKGRDYWLTRLQAARELRAASRTVIALSPGWYGVVETGTVKDLADALDSDIQWLEIILGEKRPREPWAIMARMIGPLTLAALRGADKPAGRKRRRGIGGQAGPVVRFVHDRLTRIAEQTGEPLPPELKTLYDVLKAATTAP